MVDTDDDGLSDEYERRVGLDPNNRDSDGDHWGDGYEVDTAGMNPHVAVVDDSDGDGLSTDAEILEGLNPAARDSDGDGGFDGYELEIGSNPRIGGRYIGGPKSRQRLGIGTDSDGDGLSDMTESGFGFSSKNRDTDFDGTSDYDELVLHDTKAAGVDGYFSRPQLPDSSAGSSTLDSDGDGLTDTVEYGLTPTHRADMDDDGLTDREERERGTNPLDADTDNDGYYDGFDDRPLTAGLSYHGVAASAPTDSDGDGLSDAFEAGVRLDAHNRDTDGDGLTDGAEYDLGTNARQADSDGDGINDGTEVGRAFGGASSDDPTANATYSGVTREPIVAPVSKPRVPGDFDDDGLTDVTEIEFGSDPRRQDTDGDGLNDIEEMSLGTNPRQADDTDGDGRTDFQEIYQTHTDRTVAQDWADHNGDGMSDLEQQMIRDRDRQRDDGYRALNERDSDGDGVSDLEETQRYGVTVDGEELGRVHLERRSRVDIHAPEEAELIQWSLSRPATDPYRRNSDSAGPDDQGEVDAWTARGRAIDERLYQRQISTDADGEGLTLYDELGLTTSDRSADSDSDLVGDRVETLIGLDPAKADTDGDQVWDGDEDSDGDGVTNKVEAALGYDLGSADTDGDGIDDRSEAAASISSGFDFGWSPPVEPVEPAGPAVSATTGLTGADLASFVDVPADLLTPVAEPVPTVEATVLEPVPAIEASVVESVPVVGSPPVDADLGVDLAALDATLSADADGDGRTDWEESNDWVEQAAAANAHVIGDSDGDGLVDLAESMWGTDAGNADTDGDGISDGAEVAASTNPLVADGDQGYP